MSRGPRFASTLPFLMFALMVMVCDATASLADEPEAAAHRRERLKPRLVRCTMYSAEHGELYITGALPAQRLFTVTSDHLEGICAVTELRKLVINAANLEDDSLEHLHEEEKLEQLTLQSVNLNDDGLKYVVRIKSLKALGLVYTDVTDDGLLTLAEMEKLNYLYLYSNNTTPDIVAKLKERLPGCKIIYDDGPREMIREIKTKP